MRNITATVILVAAMAAPLGAQGRGRWSQDRIPPGQMPPAGSCRVWYDGVPPGQQPAPINCRDAERIASRSRDARVIYGSDNRYDDRYGNDRNRNGRADRYENRYPDSRYPNGGGSRSGVGTVPYQNGYRDGLEKGREDARDRDSYDPVRHSRYRSADRGYSSRYGPKDQYKLVYRDGFEDGYREGFGQYRGGRGNSGSVRLPWPF